MVGSAIHDTIKLLNGEAALEVFAQIIMALVAVVSGVRKTHIGCISVFLTLFTNTRLLRRFRRCLGRLLYGERVAALFGRHCPGRGLLCLPLHRRAAGRLLRIYDRRSGRHMQAGKTHDSCICSSLFSVNASGRALGCCVPFLVEGHCGELARLKPRSCFFVRFCWRFLLLLMSLLCCLFCVVSRKTVDLQYLSLVCWCAKQAQSSDFSGSVPCCFDLGTLEQHVRCLAPSGLLLSCSCSTSLDSAFLQRRAPLPIIETQKSPWNVSDRFVSRKNNEVSVWAGK